MTAQALQDKPFFYRPFFIPPERDTFARRAARLETLAAEDRSAWQEYLRICAEITRAQDGVLSQQTAGTPPEAVPQADGRHIPEAFYSVLQQLAGRLKDSSSPALAGHAAAAAALTEAQAREAAVSWLQTGSAAHLANPVLPAAALQTVWTAYAVYAADERITPPEDRTACPCCGSEAVSAVVYSGGEADNLRYLHCSLCNSRWNVLQAKCTFCGDQSALEIHEISPTDTAALQGARAESCGKCGSYRKQFLLAKQPEADPVADDLASLALDILLGETGRLRGGHNPLLWQE